MAFILSPIRRRLGNVFYGWRVVASAFIVNAIHDGTLLFGFTVLFLPISRDLGLTRAATSLPFTLNRVTSTLVAPLIGYLIDRIGSATTVLGFGLLGGLGFLLLSRAQSYLIFAVVLICVINLGMRGLIPAATAAVVPWFAVRRSLAIAVSNTGWAVGGALIPPLIGVGVATIGWRTTAVVIAVGIWVVLIPLSRVFRGTPTSLGLQPDGPGASGVVDLPDRGRTEAGSHQAAPAADIQLSQAMRSPFLWLLSLATGLHGMISSAVTIHMVAIMTWKGLPEITAGYLVGVWAFFMAPMILIMGWMGDRWSKTKVSALGLFVRAVGWLMLLTWVDGEVWQMVVVLVFLSPHFAISSLSMAVIADWVGRRHFATIRGTIQSLSGIMGMGTPLYAGWVFDVTESYNLVVWPALGLTIVSALIFWNMPQPRAPTRR